MDQSACERLLTDISGNGRYEKLLVLIALIQAISASFLHSCSVFILGLPDSRCYIPTVDNISSFENNSFVRDIFIPWDDSTKDYSRCLQYNYNNLSACNGNYTTECIKHVTLNATQRPITNCADGYYYDRSAFHESATTEWDLVCENLYLMTLSSSSYYLGLVVGAAIGGMAGDRFGRVLVIRVATVLTFASSLALAFSINVYVLIVMIFLVAFCFMPISINGFVYACEVSRLKFRPLLGSLVNASFGMGCIILAGMAYHWRNWRELQIAISVTNLIVMFSMFFLPKSPGWLLSRNKKKEAARVCHLMAKRNKGTFCIETFEEARRACDESKSTVGIGELMKRPYLRFMLCSNAMVWCVTSFVYFGVLLNSGSLAGNMYINFLLGGVLETGVSFLSIPMITKLGRRNTTVGTLAVTSATCFLSAVGIKLGKENTSAATAGVVFAMIGRTSISASFAVIYQHTGELFPTPARSTGLGFSSLAARVGGILAPFTIQLQYSWPWLTPLVFGTVATFGSLLASLFPETKDQTALTTFDEADVFMRNHFRSPIVTKLFCLPRNVTPRFTDTKCEMVNLQDKQNLKTPLDKIESARILPTNNSNLPLDL